MLTCENCGVSFEQPEQLTEVTSLRVLCPKCGAERLAAKARKAGVPHAAVAPRALPPEPAPETGAPRPSRGPAPRGPTALGPRTATPPPAAGKPTPIPARPAPAKPAPVGKAAARPGPQSSRKKKTEIDVHATRDLQKKSSRELWISFGVAVLVIGAAGGVLWKVLGQKKIEKELEDARLAKIEGFRQEFMALDLASEESAQKLIVLADENKPTWEEADFAMDVINRTAKAKTFLQGLAERRTLTQRADAVEAILAQADELPPSELAEARRSLEELAVKADMVGADFVARVAKDREDADRVYVRRLVESAEAAARVEPLDRAALTTLQQSEDELLKVYEAAYRAWQAAPQEPVVVERKNELQTMYQGLIKLSDDAVERFFTPEVIEATPWTDLLSGDHAGAWIGASLPGFERRIENGVMHLIGPAPEAGGEAIISIGDKDQWRDFVLDMEFTLLSGEVTLFFRMPLVYQENVESVTMATGESGVIEAGSSCTLTYSLLGSGLTEELVTDASLGASTNLVRVSWTKVRKGAVAISIPKNSEAKFTRMRIKVLR